MALMWRPGRASRGILVLVALVSVAAYVLVEQLPSRRLGSFYKEKRAAARKMEEGLRVIREQKLAIFGRLDTENDPLGTGMIGLGVSAITSKEGSLAAKQTSANPNFAAVFVQWYKRAGLKEGDVVAMAFSGSFPALNLAAVVAAETLGLKPVSIASVSSSRWGANEPQLTWLDMERLLEEKGIIKHRSLAASLGGEEDTGRGLPPEGVRLLREAIARNGQELINTSSMERNFDIRMNIYREAAGDAPIACYVNIGGSLGSVGTLVNKQLVKPGLNRTVGALDKLTDSVIARFAREGIPIIHVLQIERLARRYGLPVTPRRYPRVGEGEIFMAYEYNRLLTWLVLGGLILVIFFLLRLDVSHYLLKIKSNLSRRSAANHSAPH